MAEAETKLNEFMAAMKTIAANIKKVTRGQFGKWGRLVIAKFKMRSREVLRVRSGSLSRSFAFTSTGTGDETSGRFFSSSKYAHIHEYGGTIRPVRAKMLAIPISGSPALTAAGVSRYTSPLRTTLPKEFNFWVHKSSRTNSLVLMGKKKTDGRDARAQPWYALKRSVKIPARLGFRREIRNAITELRELMRAGVNGASNG